MIGTTLSHYRILAKLGEGGMGVVYRAKDLHLERSVALKVVSKHITNGDFHAGLLREAKLAASLSHPSIAHVYEAGEADGAWYIAMEFIEGESLRKKMNSGAATLPGLIGCLLQVANALQHAHSRGVIHCDLKPENIIVSTDGLAKVLDFGLARLVRASRREDNASLASDVPTQRMSPLWSSEFIGGTIGYMSPEQAEGEEPLTASTDIFSFGCIVFETVSHRVPFADPSPIRALHQLLYDPAPKLRELTPSAPAELEQVLDICLAKDPGSRANSLPTVSEHLRRFLDSAGQVKESAHKSIGERLWPVSSENRKPWMAASLILLSLACLAVVLYLRSPRPAVREVVPRDIASIAVLPFTNVSGTPEINFLSDGLSEGLINALAQLPSLKVIARSSSFQFKGDGLNTRHVAQTLGVQALLSGRMYQSAGELRVSVELVNGADGAAIWGHQYRPGVNDLTAVEEQIVREVAGRLRTQLKPPPETRLSESSGVLPEAYSLLLRGRYEMRLYNPRSTQRAVDYYREALAMEPGFAVANAELANSYRLLSGAGILKPAEAMPLAEAAALRAIGEDEHLAQGHAVLADIRRDQWNWPVAEQEYERALHLNPNLVSAHTGFAIYLSLIGRANDAIREASKARDLDPIGVPTSINVSAVYYNCRRYDEAIRELKRSMALDPSASALWTWLGIVYGGSGNYRQAIDAYGNAMRFGDKTAATRCVYGYSLAKSGRQEEAQRILKELQSSNDYVPRTALAILFVGLGHNKRALQLLEEAFSVKDQLVQYIGVESHFDALHNNPRFQNLIVKLGLPTALK
ncbi:MAG: protein kinase domain-containing protein [Bryobacteraceae bacterium]